MVDVAQAPSIPRSRTNAVALERELAWLREAIDARIRGEQSRGLPPPPELDDDSMYGEFLRHYELCPEERLCVILTLAPHVRPHMLDVFFEQDEQLGRGRSEYGGIRGQMHGGFLPTGETALFILAGSDLAARFEVQRLFTRDHVFAQHNLLRLQPAPSGEPAASGPLTLGGETLDFLTTGELQKPDYSRDFPAKLITTQMGWDDLVLSPDTIEQIHELEAWIRHESTLMADWNLGRRLRPGYRCLLHGSPGTGKTLTAALLGKRMGRDVYRIALSTVVSKYIGETEKNLERIFDRAEHMHCILFFDEADALFGKRTNVSDAHDRYANQEVAYLLQRIEDFGGIIVLASNYSSNIDEAFMRRFQAVVHFSMPDEHERLRLWIASFSDQWVMGDDVSLEDIARRFELSGGAIMNVVRYACLMALDSGSHVIGKQHIHDGIRRELHKDGRSI